MFMIHIGGVEVGGMQVRPSHQLYFLNVNLNCISQPYFSTVAPTAYLKTVFLDCNHKPYFHGSTQVGPAQRYFRLDLTFSGG